MMKSTIFTEKEKQFLKDKNSIPKEQRGILQKRIRERMQDVSTEEFLEASKYLNPMQKYLVLKNLLYSMELNVTKAILKDLNEDLKKMDSIHSETMKKFNQRHLSYEKIKNQIDGELSFGEVSTLMKELNGGKDLLQTIAKIKKVPEYTYARKKAFDNQYLHKDKRAMEVFKLILSKKRIVDTDLTFNKLKPGIIKRYLIGFVERGIISCELAKKKNFLKDCQKMLFKMEKEGIGRTAGIELGYKIVPYQGIFKDKKKSYTFEITDYTKYLAKNLKKPLKGIKTKAQ